MTRPPGHARQRTADQGAGVEPFATEEEPPALHLPDGNGGKRFLKVSAFSRTGPNK
ncbi:hypothetical protein [Streptomyces klenkii]